ncbi:calcium-binding protein [Actinoplanes subglobosus]|uniref:Calcium-binding protein n=1 Tax=Actinoplanes subglobosus TaxID=1547892 RepID=A0ABV8IPU6_9ACTN
MNARHCSVFGTTAVALASTVLFGTPAQAASAGLATAGGSTVSFRALAGRINRVAVTVSGRTVTLTDRVAIRAGRGCRSVGRTSVRCTTTRAPKMIKIALGDKNDWVRNQSGVFMLASGAGGDDTLIGGPGADQLQGGPGNDRIYGGDGRGELFGDSGADHIVGGAGNDYLLGGPGDDTLIGGAGYDVCPESSGGGVSGCEWFTSAASPSISKSDAHH